MICDKCFILPGEKLIEFINTNTKKSLSLNYILTNYLYEEEIDKIKETDVYGGEYPVFPYTDWKKVYTGKLYYSSSKGRAYCYGDTLVRRYSDAEMAIYTDAKWFFLNWDDIKKYRIFKI